MFPLSVCKNKTFFVKRFILRYFNANKVKFDILKARKHKD